MKTRTGQLVCSFLQDSPGGGTGVGLFSEGEGEGGGGGGRGGPAGSSAAAAVFATPVSSCNHPILINATSPKSTTVDPH